jgi:hypothetical protein
MLISYRFHQPEARLEQVRIERVCRDGRRHAKGTYRPAQRGIILCVLKPNLHEDMPRRRASPGAHHSNQLVAITQQERAQDAVLSREVCYRQSLILLEK